MKIIEQAADEFLEYSIQKEKVGRYPALKEQIDEYRRKNYEFQLLSDSDELFEKIDVFQQEYEQFREDPLVSDFLAAELAFCRMMQEINIRITEGVDFE